MTVAESPRLHLQFTDARIYNPAEIIKPGLAHVTYNSRVALLAAPVDGGERDAVSGVYSDIDRAVADIVALDETRQYSIYARLQPLKASVLTTNRLAPGPSIKSDQVDGLRHKLIDIDAPHRNNEPPTLDDVALAHDVASLVWAVLLRTDIPRGALAAVQTGHGVHLTIGCHLGGSDPDVILWRDILGSLADALSRRDLGGHLIDQAVDLTRSTRIAGTMNVKYPDDPMPVWLLRPWGGQVASLAQLEQLARRGRSLREIAAAARRARQKQPGAFAADYRPAWVRELLTCGAPDGQRHTACRRLVGWFVTYAPDEAEQAVDEFVAASRWDGSEARAMLNHYRRSGKAAA